ncbi:MAG TPA: sulfur oxidation c-type cytochrome SoxX [Burkholderiales bacterium]|nr:sulfur oxidation c-type cytochrome SoxX [Burkholderiales bacterium]
MARYRFGLTLLAVLAGCAAQSGTPVPFAAQGDAIPAALAAYGDPERGRAIIAGRDANCVLCHVVPGTDPRTVGDLAPPLAGVASRLTRGQMRLRIVDSTRLNPGTIMPSYYRVEGLNRVAAQWRGKPILTAQEVEDVIAYLETLR